MENSNGKESFYRDSVKEMGSEEYLLEDPMTFWNQEKNTLWKKILGRSETPFVLVAIGLVLVLIIFFIVYPRGEDSDSRLEIDGLKDRLQQMEERINSQALKADGFAQIQEEVASMEKTVLRIDAGDASETTRLDRMAEELASMKKEMEEIKKKMSSESRPLAASGQTERKKSDSSSTIHQVQKGDTLYSISRRYGVTVETIRKLNHLSADDIHPGQELKVGQ